MIQVKDLTLQAGDFRLEDASFEVPRGDYCVLMGKTGCGKTSVLEAIAGLKTVVSGKILLGDHDVTHLHPRDRNLGYVPQDGALFHTMSVFDNLAFALHVRKWDSEAVHKRVLELAGLLEIEPLLTRRIHGLSGGEQQRVALGRALAIRPPTLLLDEPLSALDDSTHDQMCGLLENLQRQTGVTVLHVTHSHQEAQRLGQWVVRFEDGQLSTTSGERPLTPMAEEDAKLDDEVSENARASDEPLGEDIPDPDV